MALKYCHNYILLWFYFWILGQDLWAAD